MNGQDKLAVRARIKEVEALLMAADEAVESGIYLRSRARDGVRKAEMNLQELREMARMTEKIAGARR